MTGTLRKEHQPYFICVTQFLLQREMFQTTVVDKIKTHTVCSKLFLNRAIIK
jgi:hypothetical protein